MENVPNVSSEEELLRLRNEGRITEDEYEQLLGVMKRAASCNTTSAEHDTPIPAETSILAVVSLVFSILAVVLTGLIGLFVLFFPFITPFFIAPFFSVLGIICGYLALRRIKQKTGIGGRGMAVGGLIIGYVALGFCIVCSVPVVIYRLAYNQQIAREEAIGLKQREKLMEQRQALKAAEAVELKHFTLDDMEGIPGQSGLEIDRDIYSDGNGSLRIEVTQPKTVRLFQTGDMNIENTRLIYQAKVRTENLQGKVYLEMWCSFNGKGEFFSKGIMHSLFGTVDWTTLKNPFLLKEGENPDDIKLNLVIEGSGIVWIDDIRLIKYPLD